MACDFCIPLGPPPLGPSSGPHFQWFLKDSLAACPAGDSLVLGGHSSLHSHPSRLRMEVWYEDSSCNPKIGVPPESLWVTWSTASGNAIVNDKSSKVFADDSTDICGHTWITIPSFSGCGKVQVNLYISGVFKDSKQVVVRTADTNADGRVDMDDLPACDLNYDGTPGQLADFMLVQTEQDHGHRNALHGTLVRRTDYCETCSQGYENTIGRSRISWSPSQRFIAHSSFVDAGGNPPGCKIFLVPSEPKDGNALTQFSFDPIHQHDYDPSWSPLNDLIAFDRSDSVILKRVVPWSGTSETVLTASNNPGCGDRRGDTMPAISPDGQWVTFSRCNGEFGWSLWKIPIGGGTPVQLTTAAPRTDFYPSWSPDGQAIYFQRKDQTVGPGWTAWRVPAGGGMEEPVFVPPPSPLTDVAQPALSPDGNLLLFGFGEHDVPKRTLVTHTLDPTLMSPSVDQAVQNYPDTVFAERSRELSILSPRLSPDGTRTALVSKQIWAARRNMNLPPVITSVGGQAVHDTASTVTITVIPGSTVNAFVVASDPEGDPITCSADFLRSWMTFTPSNCKLQLSPPSGVSGTFYVKLRASTTTWPAASGGTDAITAVVIVGSLGPSAASFEAAPGDGPNPTRGAFALTAPAGYASLATLTIYDLTGRRVAVVRGRPGTRLIWDGKDQRSGGTAPAGVYFYRIATGTYRQDGKVVVLP